jgi:hypothetical protein
MNIEKTVTVWISGVLDTHNRIRVNDTTVAPPLEKAPIYNWP